MFKKIRKSRIFSLFQILFFIGMCFAIGAGAAYIKHKSDPTDKAVYYFRAFLENDYDEMYQYVEKEEGQYIDKDMYISIIKKIRQNIKIDSYEILEPKKDGDKYEVNVMCTDLDNNTKEKFIVRLVKKRKGLQIIPDYNIDVSEMLVNDLRIEVPSGFKLLLNNKEVTKEQVEVNSENKKDVYEIKSIINGEYTIAAQDKYSALKLTKKIVKDGETIKLSGDKYTASNKYEELIVKKSEKFIENFNSAVRSRNPERKKLLELVKKNIRGKVSQYVLESQDIVYWPEIRNIDDYSVSKMELTPLKKDIIYNKKLNNYTAIYKYNYDYTSETETSLYNSYVYSLSGNCKTTLKLTYEIKGEKVVISNISIENENTKK